MRSLSALLLFGCVLLPKDAVGRLVPIYVWRDLPTSSPTSSPSYQPSFRPSSRPTSHPSASPTISRPPSPQPSYHPSSSPTSTSFMTSKSSVNSEEMFLPSTFGFWLAMSLIGIMLCVVGVGFQLVRKSNCWQPSKCCQRSNDTQKRGKDGGRSSLATLPPVKAGGGMLSSFMSAVPSRLEELSVYSGSDDDSVSEKSLNSLPKEHLRRVPSTGSSVRSQSPRNAKRYDFMRRKPDDRNPKSDLGLQQSHSSNSNRRRDDRDTGEIAGQIIQQKTEELGNAVKETLGQAFTGLSAIAENTIFPVHPSDRTKEEFTRKQNHHQRSSDQHHSRMRQSHYRSDEVDNKSGGSTITSRESISVSSRSSSSADSASTSFASQDEPASSKTSGSAAASSDGGATSDEDDDSTAVSQQSVASFDKSVYNAIMSTLHSSTLLTPIHVTLTDNSSQAASHVGFKRGDNHFSLQIVAEEFDGLTVARRNRLIYMLLGNTMEKIQTLEIDARSPSEM
eukprot:scaffold10013_cov79-Skeletonema_dohrnii-CCMP3373.AAC.12